MKLPKKIKLAGQTINIVIKDKLHMHDDKNVELWGEFVAAEGRIYLCNNFPCIEKAQETLLHELLHAICNNRALFKMKDPDEEMYVHHLSAGLYEVMAANPKLREFLFAKA